MGKSTILLICIALAGASFGGGHEIVCAASDTPEALKGCAKYVCPADDARATLQKALDEAGSLGVRCVLLKGTYVIDHTTAWGGVNLVTEPFFEDGHGTNVTVRNLSKGAGE